MNRRCITVNLALQYLRHNKGRKGADKIKESREERKKDLETKSDQAFVSFLQLDRFPCMNILKNKVNQVKS